MKLLLFSDLHCDAAAAWALAERARDVDIVVGAGDYSTMRRGIHTTIDVLKTIDCPVVLVPGNGESPDELAAACRGWTGAHVLHGCGTTIDGHCFFGLGGGVPITPFGSWSYDLTEAEAEALLADCPARCVLVSHSPPLGALDTSSRGTSLGSSALRKTIEQQTPVLVVCGHIHECAGQVEAVGGTRVVNAGPRGIIWDLSDGSHVVC